MAGWTAEGGALVRKIREKINTIGLGYIQQKAG
jgi:hypothetical protein